MNIDYSTKINELFSEVKKLEEIINNNLFRFVNKASELVEMSEDMYQIEKSIKLNKISLKSYILDSECCKTLKQNGISNYSIDELKNYIKTFEKQFNVSNNRYIFAIYLYENLENIEKIISEDISNEINNLSIMIPTLKKVGDVKGGDFNSLYNQVIGELESNFLYKNLINENDYNMCSYMINKIFNFYINGFPNIPID